MTIRSIIGSRFARALLSIVLLTIAIDPATAQTAPVLDARVAILEQPDETEAVRRAVEDLADDLAKVFGTRPRIVTSAALAGPQIIEIARRVGGAPESFAIADEGGRVVLRGADTRGAIYAIYQFSQEYLGIDPMYYWTDRAPARRTSITLGAGLHRNYPAPLFKYRGLFINDEDQLTGWAPGENADHSGISLAVMDKIYETILRLKGNMVAPASWPFPNDPQITAAGKRGLILAQHHATPVGLNVARWPEGVPYNFTAHPEILEHAWTNAVRAHDPHQEILWSVGLRGLSDAPYSSFDKAVAGNDRAQGQLISKAIADQMRIVRAVQPNAKFITNLWQEGARLVKEGYLKIPPEVTTVWADNGHGLLQDTGQVSAGQGMYYHVAMVNGHANQLSEMVPVDRIQSELGRYIDAGATQYMLLNTSDMRAVTMTTKAVMDMAWGGKPQARDASNYYETWAAEQFGTKAAPAVAKVYQSYFKAFSHLPNGDEYGDQLYHEEARWLMLNAMMSPPYYFLLGQAPKWTPVRVVGGNVGQRSFPADWVDKTAAQEIAICSDAAVRWDAVWHDAKAAEARVTPDRRAYYGYAVLTMTAINRSSNHMLLMLNRAIRDARNGDRVKARAEAEATLADFAEIKRLQTRTSYGKWRNWWRGEWLDGIDQTHALMTYFIKWLDDPLTTLPPPVQSSDWQAYYHILHYQGDRTVDVN